MTVRSARLLALLCAVVTLLASASVAEAACPAGQVACGTQYCTTVGKVCCADKGHPELSCEAGYSCETDGTCTKQSVCRTGGQETIADCGNDTCGCSAPCKSGADCDSGCCTLAGLCAPACVCNNGGRLSLECKPGAPTTTGRPTSSCAYAPGAANASPPVAALALVALALGLRRRRTT
jgi:MYXO-CTERM domain-containing protein